MLATIAVFLAISGHAFAQDDNCDFRQYVEPGDRYVIRSQNYPSSYTPGSVCRWIGDCPGGYNCRVDCRLEMPMTSCSDADDRLLISKSGDPQLVAADRYCGYRTLTAVSSNQSISLGLIVSKSTRRGRFACNLTAQVAPKPPPNSCVCGVKKQNRIVGGTTAGPNEYPMMAGLYNPSTKQIHCGAVIISNKYVLTAAHCVSGERPGDYVVTLGDTNVDGGKKFAIESFTPHPQYDEQTYTNDIAVVKVRGTIPFNENMSPVCLPFKYQNTNITGATVTLLGWGTLEPGGKLSKDLQQVNVKAISNEQCQRTEDFIDSRKLCTYTASKDSCQNDSGGPVLLTDPSTGRLTVVGTISNGYACASDRPGINTRTTAFLSWIVDNAPAEYCVIT